MVKLAINLEKRSSEVFGATNSNGAIVATCFCGYKNEICGSGVCGEGAPSSATTAPSSLASRSTFKKEFVILEVSEIGLKFHNNPFNPNGIVLGSGNGTSNNNNNASRKI